MRDRITPAGAGNSAELQRNRRGLRDHPRGCGEQHLARRPLLQRRGSPPRVRGTVSICRAFSLRRRITPAGAGNRSFPNSIAVLKRDHPRGCGEQGLQESSRHLRSGSPPRVRGTDNRTAIPTDELRITPAGAGNRRFFAHPLRTCRDHPRGCGEQPRQRSRTSWQTGSPPRVRGTESG